MVDIVRKSVVVSDIDHKRLGVSFPWNSEDRARNRSRLSRAVVVGTRREISMPRRPSKNPFMSLWLSGANKVAGTTLGLWRAAASQQQSAMARAAGKQSASYWNQALKTLSPRKRRKSGK
jgi:hypothetical protein